MLISVKLWSLAFIRFACILFTQANRNSNPAHEFYENSLPLASGLIFTCAVERYECGDSAILLKLYMVYG
uniref:Secreted protein n=1 Tax=Wuchereria bancrofti TaxID=6293 RepID=A0AAF5PHA7_WUCBA